MCTMKCRNKVCYRIQGDGFDRLICSDKQSCSFSQTLPLAIDSCSTQMTGKSCENNLCLYIPFPISTCLSDITPAQCSALTS